MSMKSLKHDVCCICNSWKHLSEMKSLQIDQIPNRNRLIPHADVLKVIPGFTDEVIASIKITTGLF